MVTAIEVLEQRIESLRGRVRRALIAGDRDLAVALRRELRDAEQSWDDALVELAAGSAGQGVPSARGGQAVPGGELTPPGLEPAAHGPARDQRPDDPGGRVAGSRGGGMALPLREQVHQALTLLSVPAAPRLVSSVHEAFFAGAISGTRLTSLRRDEERSFRVAPFARPYYVCAALTADLLAPARGLLAVSTWPVDRRVIGPLSPRVDFLTAAIQVAEGIERISAPGPGALRLLWRFASNIPGGMTSGGNPDPRRVAEAAEAERGIHAGADQAARRDAAQRARAQLGNAQQLFGARLRAAPRSAAGG